MTTTVTSKGQVTIPKRVRDAAGIKPGATVLVEFVDGKVVVSPTKKRRDNDFEKRLRRARAHFNIGGMTTDEFMKLMRGDD
jgi:AbrB family looped-hinge helix DNA binding protein